MRHCVISVRAAANRSMEQAFLRCLYCHYVFDDQRDDFRRLLVRLMEMGTFIDTDRCVRMLSGDEKIDRRYFHLSFDDGFRNIYTNALPILKEIAVPAIIFVPSSHITGRSGGDPRVARSDVYRSPRVEMLQWDDLKALRDHGVGIGAHTMSHARLSAISHDNGRLTREIAGSKDDIEHRLGIECRYFSWPYGRLTDVDDRSIRAVKDAGYHACFGAFRGSVVPGKTDLFRIPRHHFEAHWPLQHIAFFARGNMETTFPDGTP